MKSNVLTAAVVAGAFACLSSAQAGMLVPLPPVPGSYRTIVEGINNKNVVTGYYDTSDGASHGFVGTIDGNYQTFDFPNDGTVTAGTSLNDKGYITVETLELNDDCPVVGCQYLRTAEGVLKPIMRDGHKLDGVPGQIIAGQKFVGSYGAFNEQGRFSFYGYYGKGAKYQSDIILPVNTDDTDAFGYNKAGVVVGAYRDNDKGGDFVGFLLKNGAVTSVRYPDDAVRYTFLNHVNDKGVVAGRWEDQDRSSHAFLYKISKNKFLPIPDGSTFGYATRINNSGVVAIMVDANPYIYCTKQRACPLKVAGAKEIPEHWISAARFSRTLPCKNGCMGPHHESAIHDPAVVRAAIDHDPALQHELHHHQ